MIKLLVFVLVALAVLVGTMIKRHGFSAGLALTKQFVATEWSKLFKSATLWLSYAMMAWPVLVQNLSQDTTWANWVPAAWHDKSISILGGLVWLARMRSVLPKAPPAAAPPSQ